MTKVMSPIGKMLIFGSVVKVSFQEMNVSLCNVPTKDLGQCVCVFVCLCLSQATFRDKFQTKHQLTGDNLSS